MTSLHWVRAFVYSLFAEIIIFAVASAAGSVWGPAGSLYSLLVTSFVGMLLFGFLLAKRVERRVAHGTLVGVFGAGVYLPLFLFPAAAPPSPTPEQLALARWALWTIVIAEVLKIVGGFVGGLIAERQSHGSTRQTQVSAGSHW